MFSDANAEYNKALALPGSRTFGLAGLGRAYVLSGKNREARQVLDELEATAKRHYVPAVYLAAIFAAMGDRERSIQWIGKAHDERSDYLVYLKTDPWADPLRSDPRFQHLVQLISHGQ